jgi:hypothetical protein
MWTFFCGLAGYVSVIVLIANIYSFWAAFRAVRKYPMEFRDIKSLLVHTNCARIIDDEVIFGDDNAGLCFALRKGSNYKHDSKSTAYISTNKVLHHFYMTDQHREELLLIARKQIADQLKEKIEQSILDKAIVDSSKQIDALNKANIIKKV